MRRLLFRILRHGIPAALVLALVGYVMAEMAGVWVSTHVVDRENSELLDLSEEAPKPNHGDEIADTFRGRLPFTMAAWGFGLVVFFELMLRLWRGDSAAAPPTPPTVPVNPNAGVEQLLNQLLEKEDADRAAKAAQKPPTENKPTS